MYFDNNPITCFDRVLYYDKNLETNEYKYSPMYLELSSIIDKKTGDEEKKEYGVIKFTENPGVLYETVIIFNDSGNAIGTLNSINEEGIVIKASPDIEKCKVNSDSITLYKRAIYKNNGKERLRKDGNEYAGVKYEIYVKDDVMYCDAAELFRMDEIIEAGK